MKHTEIPAPIQMHPQARRTWTRLMRTLDERQAWNGHAFLTEPEARFLRGWHLKQPGHTRYPYSVRNEDLSDIAQEAAAS